MVGEAKWKPVKLPLPMKIVDQKQCCILRELKRLLPTINHLKDAGVRIPTTSPLTNILALAKGKWI